jgi:hypothetical protein
LIDTTLYTLQIKIGIRIDSLIGLFFFVAFSFDKVLDLELMTTKYKRYVSMIATLKIIAVSVVTIIQSVFAFGQGRSSDKTNQIKISPVRLVDPVNPGLEFNYEKFYAKQYSSQLSVAYMKDLFKVTAFDGYKGLRVSLEERYYHLPKKTQQPYYSGELVYLKVDYTDRSSYRKDTALLTPQYADTFHVAKQTLSLNLKYGIQIPIKRSMIDISFGLGIKYKMVRRTGIYDANAYEVTPIDPNVYYMASKGGNYFGISLPVNIKIAFPF